MRRSDCFLLSKYTTVLSSKYTTFGDEGGMAATFGCLEPFDATSLRARIGPVIWNVWGSF